MRLSVPQGRAGDRAGVRGENVVPMINVSFLLLIFFLMAAELAAPAPVAVTLPRAAGQALGMADVEIYIDAVGVAAFDDARGDAALARVAALAGPHLSLTIRADAGADAGELAALLPRLSGFGSLRIATVPQ